MYNIFIIELLKCLIDNDFFYDSGSNFSESVMCEFRGNLKEFNSISANLDPKSIPIECEVIIYSTFTINASSFIDVDEGKYIFYWIYLSDIIMEYKYAIIYRLII